MGVPAAVRRTINDLLVFASGAMILIFALVATDERVRERAALLVAGGHPVANLSGITGRFGDLLDVAMQVARGWSREHWLWSVFAVATLLLVVALTRLDPWR